MSKSKTIAFRLSDEDFALIEKAAAAAGKNPNDWARGLLIQASSKSSFTPNEQILFEEFAKMRYMIGIGFGLLASDDLTTDKWSETKRIVDEKGKDIADALLERRR